MIAKLNFTSSVNYDNIEFSTVIGIPKHSNCRARVDWSLEIASSGTHVGTLEIKVLGVLFTYSTIGSTGSDFDIAPENQFYNDVQTPGWELIADTSNMDTQSGEAIIPQRIVLNTITSSITVIF